MATHLRKISAASAALAAFSMSATPLAAAPLPVGSAGVEAYHGDAENVEQYRRYRRDRGIDAGDVIAGVAVIGAIAAIASAASNNNRDRVRYRDRDYRYRDRDYSYRSRTGDYDRRATGYDSRGIERAVDMCVSEVERSRRDRVGDVDDARRDASGWAVGGALANGQRFTCRIDNNGRVRDIDVGSGYSYSNGGDYYGTSANNGQLDDATYARARAQAGSQADRGYQYRDAGGYDAGDYDAGDYDGNYDQSQQPAYPGGPLPGEEGYLDPQGGAADGRYESARAGVR